MLITTRGLVFRTFRYGETSLVAKIYTEKLGLQSYMVRGLRSKKSSLKQALFQHLTPVELVSYFHEKKELQNLKEIKVAYPFKSIPLDIRKSTILLFLNDVLYHVIREEEPNPELFTFLFNALTVLDELSENIGSFHHLFLMELTRFLGFFPKNNYSEQHPNFDLMQGEFIGEAGPETLVAVSPYGRMISELAENSLSTIPVVSVPGAYRARLLEYLLSYYRHHIPDLKEFRSHQVLKEVLE